MQTTIQDEPINDFLKLVKLLWHTRNLNLRLCQFGHVRLIAERAETFGCTPPS